MATAIKYMFMFVEETDDDNILFFDKSNLHTNLLKGLSEAFVDAGGFAHSVSYYHDENVNILVRETVSYWNTPDSYEKWLADSRTQEYIDLRDQHNKKYDITARLYGPYPEELGSP